MSGLGLVVSESAAVNLPLDRPFIDVIPEDRITDRQFIQKVIRTNQCKSVALRKEIRHYAETHLDWKQLVAGYLKQLEIFLREKSH